MADKYSNCLWPLIFSVMLVYLQAFPVVSQVTATTTSGVSGTPPNAATDLVTGAATIAVTNSVTIATTNLVTQAATNAVTNVVTVAVTNTLSNSVTDPVTESVTNAATSAVTTAVTGAMTEAVTATVTEAGTNPVTGAMTEAVTFTATDEVTNPVTEESVTPDNVTDFMTDFMTELVNVTLFTDASNTSNITLGMETANTTSTLSPNVTLSEKKVYKMDQNRTVIIPIIIFTLLLFLLAVMIFIATYTRIRLKKSVSTYRLTPVANTTTSHVGYQNTAYEHGDIADDTDIECSMRDIRLDLTSTNGDTMNNDPEALKNPEGLEEELTPL